MKQSKYNFYIGKHFSITLYYGASIADDGNPIVKSGAYTTYILDLLNERLYVDINLVDKYNAIFFYDENQNLISMYSLADVKNSIITAPDNAKYWACRFTNSDKFFMAKMASDFMYYVHCVNIHYNDISKKVTKESGQEFFRETIDGKLVMFGKDYDLIKNSNLNDQLIFLICTSGNELYYKGSFNKTDCKLDDDKKKCEFSATPLDEYTDILNKYDNSYDIIKLRPEISKINIYKRPLTQVYIQGAQSVSNFFGGTYWESDVNESIEEAHLLVDKYFFAYIGAANEFYIDGAHIIEDINGVYAGKNGVFDKWEPNYTCKAELVKSRYNAYSFRIYRDSDGALLYQSLNNYSISDSNNKFISDENMKFTYVGPTSDRFSVIINDSFKISGALIEGVNTTFSRISGTLVWDSSNFTIKAVRYNASGLYGFYIYRNADNAILYKSLEEYPLDLVGPDEYKAVINNDEISFAYIGPSSDTFTIKNMFVYHIYTRTLCDIDYTFTIDGKNYSTKDLPIDDFVSDNRNYKKCVNVYTGFFFCTSRTETEPTRYGINDYKRYFTNKFIVSSSGLGNPLPISRNYWANASLWYVYDDITYKIVEQRLRKKYTLKDSYSLASVISALLKEITPSITHEASVEYSQFLYSEQPPLPFMQRFYVYLTQKTNILKGDYDQAAQKAETSLKNILDMLRDCFRCYWYIDNGKLKIEHIRFFINGGTYSYSQVTQLDLTSINHAFNRKNILYFQNNIEFDKSDLNSRYEFNWADGSTDLFGNMYIDVKDNYVQKDKVEEINIDNFSSDIDFMLYNPNSFSEDGFALLCPILIEEQLELPIIETQLINEDKNTYTAIIQNYYASWPYLIKFYLYDMPGKNIWCNTLGNIIVEDIKMCMSQSIEIIAEKEINTMNTIKTQFGNGLIDNFSISLSTNIAKIKLLYKPI